MKNYKKENVYYLNGVLDGFEVTTLKRTDGENTWFEAFSNSYISDGFYFGGGSICFETQDEMEKFYSDWMDELNSVQG